ncbi:hypothetical protein GcM3_186059 [Golovinomyces cichoracearum]|uniref:Uncharacterized protein n=1 Tax=Golovinomyces cichoracearum TaxID=62708 RepID=A0A420HK34_9PEZI|nr:hypothetical protein GcM3_186059 [Golovinomyces cichoracearum]
MIPSVTDIIHNEEDSSPIRNNEPDSYTIDEVKWKNIEERVELKTVGDSKSLLEDHLNLTQKDKLSVHEQMTGKLPVSRLNPGDIDERHIVFGK